LTFNSDATITDLGTNLSIYYPTSTITVANSQAFSFVAMHIEGVLSGGGGNLTVTGSMTWQGGTISGFRTLSIASEAALDLGDPSNSESETVVGATLENAGTATLSSAGKPLSSGLVLESGAVLDNQPGATLMLMPNASIFGDGTTRLINEGALAVSPQVTGFALIQSAFSQTTTGSTTIDGGHVLLQGGGSIGGSITLAMGTVLEFDSPLAYELDSSSTISGAGLLAAVGTVVTEDGTYNFAGETQVTQGGTLTFNSDATITDLGTNLSIYYPTSTITVASSQAFSFVAMHIEGVLSGGGGDLNVTGSITWQGGMLDGFRTLRITASASLTLGDQAGADTEVLRGVSLKSAGSVTLAGPYGHGGAGLSLEDGASVDNQQGSSFTVVSSAQISSDGSAIVFANEGTLVPDLSDSGTSTFTVPLINTGSVNVQQGTLNLSTATNSGSVTVATGASLGANGYTQTAGTTALNGGYLNGGTYNIIGGALLGSGTVNANVVNGGLAIPGGAGSSGMLTINGNYTQTATGRLNIELGGMAFGTSDLLAVSDTVSLGGTLNIATLGSFAPAFGSTLQVMTFGASAGNFNSYTGTSLGSGLFLDPVFNSSSLTLAVDRVAIGGAPPVPLQGNPINLTASVTGPSAGNSFTFSWNVTQNGNPFGSGSGAAFTFTPDLHATYLVTLTVTDVIGGKGIVIQSIVVAPSIFVLNPTASGALTLSGNASINIPGEVVVDSSSATALTASGNAQLNATVVDVRGGFQKTGNATVSPAPSTGVSINDPLGSLGGPSASGTPIFVSLSKGTQSISQGVYSQISVSGNASLTLGPGIYVIEGGGLTVTGNASISGQNVCIYNAGSNYPGNGGNFGGIALSGNGTFNLSAPTSGTYAGILIFQSRQNTRALSLSGNALAGMSGLIYAPNALLSMSGNAALTSALDVGMLNLSGNTALMQTATGSDGSGDTSGIANTLLAGNLSLYINDSTGLFTADELARIQDSINTWDAILAPYNVTIAEVSDPTVANIVIDTSTTSACGGSASGVLGCYNAPNGEITLIQGWNWYAGTDASKIGANQYDFETTVLHELGHALGLGGSTNPSSPMCETLASGVALRTVNAQDLNIPDPPEGADPQTAAGFQKVAPISSTPIGISPQTGAGPAQGAIGLMPPAANSFTRTSSSTTTSLVAQDALPEKYAAQVVQPISSSDPGPRLSPALQEPDRESAERFLRVPRTVADSVIDELAISAVRAKGKSLAPPMRDPGLPWSAVTSSLVPASPVAGVRRFQPVSEIPTGRLLPQHPDSPPQPAGAKVWLADILFAVGFCGYGAGTIAAKSRRTTIQGGKRQIPKKLSR
jgi:hypothetical protein